MPNCYFKDEWCFTLKLGINFESKFKALVYRFYSQIHTDPIFSFNLKSRLKFLRNNDSNMWVTGFNCQFIIITKLFRTLTKTSCHFEVQKRYGITIDYFLLFFLSKANTIRNSTCSLNDLVYDIITNRAILETDNIYNTVGFYCIFNSYLLI